jgi:hypothetical protein
VLSDALFATLTIVRRSVTIRMTPTLASQDQLFSSAGLVIPLKLSALDARAMSHLLGVLRQRGAAAFADTLLRFEL